MASGRAVVVVVVKARWRDELVASRAIKRACATWDASAPKRQPVKRPRRAPRIGPRLQKFPEARFVNLRPPPHPSSPTVAPKTQLQPAHYGPRRPHTGSLVSTPPSASRTPLMTRLVAVVSPWVILSDFGSAFAMGAVGGTIWHGIKGARNSPRVSNLCSRSLVVV